MQTTESTVQTIGPQVISLCGMILHKLIEEDHHEEVRFRLEAEVSAL